jgi:hypothetical protein
LAWVQLSRCGGVSPIPRPLCIIMHKMHKTRRADFLINSRFRWRYAPDIHKIIDRPIFFFCAAFNAKLPDFSGSEVTVAVRRNGVCDGGYMCAASFQLSVTQGRSNKAALSARLTSARVTKHRCGVCPRSESRPLGRLARASVRQPSRPARSAGAASRAAPICEGSLPPASAISGLPPPEPPTSLATAPTSLPA